MAPTREQILADPNVQAILRDPRYTSPQLSDAAVNNYLANDPRSPFRGTFGAGASLNSAGYPQTGSHYNTQTGGIDETNLYGHPGTMKAVGLGSVGAAGTLASLGLLPGMGSASAAPAATHGAVDLSTAPAYGVTSPGVMAGTSLPAELGSMTPTQMASAFGGGTASGIGRNIIDQLTSGNGIAGLAGLLTTLATRPGSGSGGSGGGITDNAQLQRLLDMSTQRAERTDPLHQAITQLAMNRLPTNVQR